MAVAGQPGSNEVPRPDISVLMCVHNGANYVVEAIESTLAQADVDFEFVVVNDGSTDETMELLDRYRAEITVVDHPANDGIGTGRNLGVEHSRGRHLVFSDHDDLLPPGSLAARRDPFDAEPGLDMVVGAVDEFVPDELRDKLRAEGVRPRQGIAGSLTSIMVRREAFERVGPFEPLRNSSCMNWMMRAKTAGISVHRTDQVVYRRRLHETNSSRQHAVDQRSRLEAVRRARAERGAAGSADSSLG